MCSPAGPATRSPAAASRIAGATCWRSRPRSARAPALFLGFQYPVEIPGVNNVYLLKAALNAARKQQGLPEVDAFEFLALVREKMKLMQMDEAFLSRGVNEGFSGGEKKRNEILQMLVLEPNARRARRDRLGPRHRRAEGRRARRQHAALQRARHRARHALPAAAGPHRARSRARAGARAASCAAATATSRSNSRSAATTGSPGAAA